MAGRAGLRLRGPSGLRDASPLDESSFRGADLRVTWPDGTFDTHRALSFGQKRLFAFLWHCDVSPTSPVFADELTNGFNARWMEPLLDHLEGRQVFHALQNPLLLDWAGLAARPEVPGQFVFCSVDSDPEGRRWAWRNPTDAEADSLREGWEAGHEALSRVLMNRGMW